MTTDRVEGLNLEIGVEDSVLAESFPLLLNRIRLLNLKGPYLRSCKSGHVDLWSLVNASLGFIPITETLIDRCNYWNLRFVLVSVLFVTIYDTLYAETLGQRSDSSLYFSQPWIAALSP